MVGAYNGTAVGYGSRAYSPLTLNNEWPKMSRLLFLLGSSFIGTLMNGFFVATFFVDAYFRKVGNVFLTFVGISELILTAGVLPPCTVVLLSGEWDVQPVCYALHFVAQTGIYAYNMFFMLVAVEISARVFLTTKQYSVFKPMNVGIVAASILVICIAVAWVGVYQGLDYHYCTRAYFGNDTFRIVTGIVFYVVPFVVTMSCLIISFVYIRRKAQKRANYKRSLIYERDFSAIVINLAGSILNVCAWTPCIILLLMHPGTSDANFYQCVWLGLYRSVYASFLYACLNRNFRRAFGYIFNYCCCKRTLSGNFNSQRRRTLAYRTATGEIRVHLLHQIIRARSRGTQEL